MGKLVIITGEMGCGKTTYANKFYSDGGVIFDSFIPDDIENVKESVKNNRLTVVCCSPVHTYMLIREIEDFGDNCAAWKMVTLGGKYEVLQVCGRGLV